LAKLGAAVHDTVADGNWGREWKVVQGLNSRAKSLPLIANECAFVFERFTLRAANREAS
jgi:hypothetical protein